MAINNILDYTPPPDEETFRKRRNLLIIAATVSLIMTAIGYALMVLIILKK